MPGRHRESTKRAAWTVRYSFDDGEKSVGDGIVDNINRQVQHATVAFHILVPRTGFNGIDSRNLNFISLQRRRDYKTAACGMSGFHNQRAVWQVRESASLAHSKT